MPSIIRRFPLFNSKFIILSSAFLILISCSVQKQIARSAKENVLSAPALQTAHVGISIYEPAADKYWYDYQGDHYFVPASNTKIPTCYAAMKYLGDSLAGARYYEENGQLYILPAADPTFLLPEFKNQPVFDFISKSKFTYIGVEWEKNLWREQIYGSGWAWNDYTENYAAPRSPFPMYGNIVRFNIKSDSFFVKNDSTTFPIESYPSYFINRIIPGEQGYNYLYKNIQITRSFDQNKFTFTNSNRPEKVQEMPFYVEPTILGILLNDTIQKIASSKRAFSSFSYNPDSTIRKRNLNKIHTIHSQPTDSLLKPMMHRSDNFFAEQALLMVSNERLGIMNDAKIIDTLLKTDLKDLPQKPRWVDGSGLSRYNLFSPRDLVTIFNKMKNEFGMERIKNILPTGGEGTISSYYKPESGYLFAKTGTLSGVVSISGFLYTKKKKLLIFSVLINNHNASATDVRRAVEKFIEGIRNKY